MNLQQLQEAGGFVETEPVCESVTWTRPGRDGQPRTDTFDVWIRRRSFGAIERVLTTDGDRSKSAEMIVQCLLLGDERQALTYEQAYQLDSGLAMVLLDAINRASAPKA